MTELDKILADMDPELFEGSGSTGLFVNENENREIVDYLGYGEVDYQEDIQPEMASALIPPSEYDPACRYQIITMRDHTILLRIDDRIAMDRPLPTRHHITEFELNTDKDVQTYEEMRQEILLRPEILESNTMKNVYTEKKSRWWLIPLLLFLVLLFGGIVLIYFTLNYF